ncbi:hybrid sensor histidine kinase/response regulator [Halorussus halophilus]|uniref:hybrid sensor histidine kinase/response regulator n=1 Tax=Halorussus halophilus TaxID=2650975 RepID=UPI0013013565|nr:PAS domain-containing protein [Halorussus halophilus]
MDFSTGSHSEDSIRVLHVEHGDGTATDAENLLEQNLDTVEVTTKSRVQTALDCLDTEPIDCVVSDTELRDEDPLDFLEVVRRDYPDLPFIFFTGEDDEHLASEAILGGANDWLQKEGETAQFDRLQSRIRSLVGEYRTKRELRENRRQFETLLSNLPGLAYRCRNERDWPMEFVSEGCRELTGYDPEQLTDGGVSFGDDITHPDDREAVWQTVEKALEDGTSFQVDYRIRTADDELKWVWEQGELVSRPDESTVLEGFVMDVTDWKMSKRRLRILNRVLRHNLRNDMNVIMGYADEISKEVEDDDLRAEAETIESIATDVASLSDSTSQIEALIEIEPANRRPFDVSTLIEASVERIREKYPEAEITVEQPNDAWVHATKELQFVLQHTLDNAVVHNHSAVPRIEVTVREALGTDDVLVEVADDGPGIPQMEIDALDTPEETTSLSHGSGLGLWVMKWGVESLGGDLTFATNQPTGTVVRIRLPEASPPS